EVTEDGYRAIGDFTMKGVTTTVALPFIIIGLDRLTEEKPVIGISAQISLNRLDYGVGNDFIHRTIPQFLGPKVEIEIDMWTRPGKYQP
ncbi:MAG: YceI family protein, partial [Nitrospinae bacterium]|nr:YceI family protein [Nitrospinota bacterium]